MIIHHGPHFRPLDRADAAIPPVVQALLRHLERIGDPLGIAEFAGEKVEGFTVRHAQKTKRSVEFVNIPFRCAGPTKSLVSRP